LGFLFLPANDAFVGHEEKIPERVQGFAFVGPNPNGIQLSCNLFSTSS
jgi:hypothetical protein